MPQPKPWLKEIEEALLELGGMASYADLYAAIETRGIMTLDVKGIWQAVIRRTIEQHSSHSAVHHPGAPDIFYSVDGIGKGRWGLRSLQPTPNLQETPSPPDDVAPPEGPAKVLQVTYRHLRDTKTARELKAEYYNKCQVCGLQLVTQGGSTYSEAHHIIPLGNGHNGLDKRSNLLVLCPNHHAEFDYGAIAIHPITFLLRHQDTSNPWHEKSLHEKKHDLATSSLQYHWSTICKF